MARKRTEPKSSDAASVAKLEPGKAQAPDRIKLMFSFDTTSRAFNPAGYDGGYAADWNYDNPWPLESNPSVSVAIVGP